MILRLNQLVKKFSELGRIDSCVPSSLAWKPRRVELIGRQVPHYDSCDVDCPHQSIRPFGRVYLRRSPQSTALYNFGCLDCWSLGHTIAARRRGPSGSGAGAGGLASIVFKIG
jgi:hypothetical protein